MSVSGLGRVAGAALLGYVVGSFPSADVAARLARSGDVDLRSTGSGNPGALNAARQLGTRWGVAVLIADGAKGAVGPVLARRLAGGTGAYAAASAAIAGHIVPPWSGFRGGKGVATSAGACLAVFPAYFPVDAVIAAAMARGTRRPETTIAVSSTAWMLSSLLWWRRGWPNLWGPRPTAGLPAFATTSSAMILAKFAAARRAAAMARVAA